MKKNKKKRKLMSHMEARLNLRLTQEISSLKAALIDLHTFGFYADGQNPLYLKNQLDSQGVLQMNLVASWKVLQQKGHIIQDLHQIGFRVFSQNNEDGILLYLFTIIGTTNKLFVEIGANTEDSHIGIPENNTTNLIVYHGWNGLIIDADKKSVDELTYFFARCKSTKHFHWQNRKSKREDESNYFSPMVKQKFVTAEGINDYLRENKVPAEIDLLSIDIDGMDYYIWKAISITSPRVVIIEFNQRLNFSGSHFLSPQDLHATEYPGCSLTALVLLAKEKSYRLVAISSSGFNAVFMRNDIGVGLFNELTEEQFRNSPLWHWTEETDFILASKPSTNIPQESLDCAQKVEGDCAKKLSKKPWISVQ